MIIKIAVKTALITSIAIAILLMGNTMSYADDSNNHYKDDPTSVFAPGYLNAAKYQAEAIVAQQTQPKKSLLQNITEYLQGKTENNVEQAVADKPKPVLQQKQSSGGGKGKVQTVASAVLNANSNSTEVPAYIRNIIQDYITKNFVPVAGEDFVGVKSGIQIKALNGEYCAVWADAGETMPGLTVKALLFDSQGAVISQTPLTAINNPMPYYDGFTYDFSIFSNGNVAIYWNMEGSGIMNAQFLNKDGTAMSTAPVTLTLGAGVGSATIKNVSALSDDNIAVFQDESDYNGNCTLKEYFVNSQSGTMSAAPVTLLGGMSNYSTGNVSVLSDGKVAVVWGYADYFSGGGGAFVQFFNSDGSSPSTPVPISENSGRFDGVLNVSVLSEGRVVVFYWCTPVGGRTLNAQFFNSDGTPSVNTVLNGGTGGSYVWTQNFSVLSDGRVVAFWTENGVDGLNVQLFNPNGTTAEAPVTLIGGMDNGYVNSISILSNGNIAVFWSEEQVADFMLTSITLKAQFFKSDGTVLSDPITLAGGSEAKRYIDSVSALSNGDVAVFWDEPTGLNTQVFDSQGNFLPIGSLTPSFSANANLADLGQAVANSYVHDPLTSYYDMAKESNQVGPNSSYLGADSLGGILKTLLTNDNPMLKGAATGADTQGAFQLALTDALKGSALSLPQGQIPQADMEIAMRLASILSNPTDDQKALIDVIKSLLADTDKVKEDASKNANPALIKAQNDLLQAVANILLAQGIPDLLKQGDMSNIKGIFSELDTQKNKIMREYVTSTKPYYNNTLKDIAKNIAVLQLKNILKPGTTQEDLDKLPPSELDKILEKIKKEENRTFEEEYILQQEAKYRKEYLDPNKKKLEDNMKTMLNDFTSKINDVLKTADKK